MYIGMCVFLFLGFSHLRLFDHGVSSSLLLSHPFKTCFFFFLTLYQFSFRKHSKQHKEPAG